MVSNSGQIITPHCKQYLGGPQCIALLLTSRKIHVEAREVLYGSRRFSIGINQMSCIGYNSKPNTPLSYQAVPATWSKGFRDHLYLMTKLNVYIHLDRAVLKGSEEDPPEQPDNTVLTAINTAYLGEDLISNLPWVNVGFQHLLQGQHGNPPHIPIQPLPLPTATIQFNAQNNPGVNLAVNHAFGPFVNVAANPAANAGNNPNGAALNAVRNPSPSALRALGNQNMDNVMVVKAALEELCQVLSMCGKLKDINVIYIDRTGDYSPAGLGINILRPFKTLASSIRCQIKYVPIRGRSNQTISDRADKCRMDGAYFQQNTTFHDTLCHLKAISLVSTVELAPTCITELDHRLEAI